MISGVPAISVELDLYRLLVETPGIVDEGVERGIMDRIKTLDDIFLS